MLAVLANYQRYLKRRGSKAFSFAKTRQDGTKYEAVYHYSLDAYLSSLVERLGGYSSVEFPTGNGKVDIWLTVREQRYVIESKNYVDESQITKAREQAARYARNEGIDEAYLVIFTERQGAKLRERVATKEVEGIKLHMVYISVDEELG